MAGVQYDPSDIDKTWVALGNLMGCLGVVQAIVYSQRDHPVLEGWHERLTDIRRFANAQTQDLMDFGSAYDQGLISHEGEDDEDNGEDEDV